MGSQRMPTEVGKKIKQGVAERKFAGEDLCDPLEMGAFQVIYSGDGIRRGTAFEGMTVFCSEPTWLERHTKFLWH